MLSKRDIKILKSSGEKLKDIHLPRWFDNYTDNIESMEEEKRWNGRDRKVSMVEIIQDHDDNIESLMLLEKAIKIARTNVSKASAILCSYEKCTTCDGEQGIWSEWSHGSRVWDDCEDCEGHGYNDVTKIKKK